MKRKRKKQILGILAVLFFILAIGAVGGMERGSIDFKSGAILSIVFLAICEYCTYLAGGFIRRTKKWR